MSGAYKALGGKPLQDWLTVRIKEEDGVKHVIFHSRIHVNNLHKMTISFNAADYTDFEILHSREVRTTAEQLYGAGMYKCQCHD